MKRITQGLLTCICLFSNNALTATDCDNQQLLNLESCTGDSVDSEETLLFNLINEYRIEKGLAAITLSPALSLVANRHVMDLQKNAGSLTHSWSNCNYNSSDPSTYPCMWEAPQRLKTSYTGNGYENAYRSSEPVIAAKVLTNWKQSPAHNEIILNQSIWKDITWNALGVGIYQGYAVIWFGEKEDNNAVLSKVFNSTPAQEDRILELYSAYFNRAADADGLDFWKKSFNSYYTEEILPTGTATEKETLALQRIAEAMSQSEEYITLYPSSLSSTDFIDAIYINLLDRPSDFDGLNFWANHINKGTMSKEQAILNMITGAKENKSPQGIIDNNLITNRNSISSYFANTLGLNDTTLAGNVFSTITDNLDTVEPAKAILDLSIKLINAFK